MGEKAADGTADREADRKERLPGVSWGICDQEAGETGIGKRVR